MAFFRAGALTFPFLAIWIWITKGLDAHWFCNRGSYTNRMLWHILVISGSSWLRQEDCKCKASLGYTMRFCLIKDKKCTKTNQPINQATNQPTNQTDDQNKRKEKEGKKLITASLSLKTRHLPFYYLNVYLIMFLF